MKRFVVLLFPFIALLNSSWSLNDHQNIGAIADRYLSAQAKLAVKEILNGRSLADISNQADERESDPEYKLHTAWHDIKLPAGLTHEQFVAYVKELRDPNLYIVYKQFAGYVSNPFGMESNAATENSPAANLKWLVSNVEDMHDPVHVGPDAKGENAARLAIGGKKTSLYTFWDNMLGVQPAKTFNKVALQSTGLSASDARKLQADPVMQWLWESYQYDNIMHQWSAKVTAITPGAMEAMQRLKKQRMEQAGIRLAGLLNSIFGSYEYQTSAGKKTPDPNRANPILIKNAPKHVGDSVVVYGRLFLLTDPSSIQPLWAVKSGITDKALKVVVSNDISRDCLSLQGRQVTLKGVLTKQTDELTLEINDPAGIMETGDIFNEFR